MWFDNWQLSYGLPKTKLSQLTDLIRNGESPTGPQGQDPLAVSATRDKQPNVFLLKNGTNRRGWLLHENVRLDGELNQFRGRTQVQLLHHAVFMECHCSRRYIEHAGCLFH